MSILALLIFILKIIGILLALLFLVFCFVIFSGINLIVLVNNKDGILKYDFKITYLFGVINYRLNNEYKKLKIFGINFEKFKLSKKNKKKESKVNKKDTYSGDSEIFLNENDKEKDIFNLKQKDDTVKENVKQKNSTNKQKVENKKSILINKLNKIKNGYNNIKDILSKILNYPDKEKIIKLTLNFINRILKSIKFKKFKINLEYGFQEPFQTGVFCGIISSIVPFLPKKCIKELNIMPNFENEVFLLDTNIKCKTSIYRVLLPIVMFISKKPIKNLIFRKGE